MQAINRSCCWRCPYRAAALDTDADEWRGGTDDLTPQARTTFKYRAGWALWPRRVLLSISCDLGIVRRFCALADAWLSRCEGSNRVLVIDCDECTASYGTLKAVHGVGMRKTNASLEGSTSGIRNASDRLFANGQGDLAIGAAAKESKRCVDQVLGMRRTDRLASATTPFMRQVLIGIYDFTHFSRAGYRWLHRPFEEVRGARGFFINGLCWAWQVIPACVLGAGLPPQR
jgi:hypothetical protein